MFIALLIVVAIIQVIMITDENVVYDARPVIIVGIVLGTVLISSLVTAGIIYFYARKIIKLNDAFANQQYEKVIKNRNCSLFLKKGSKERDSILYAVAVSYLEIQNYEMFLKYINNISYSELINAKFLWIAIYSVIIEDYEQFTLWKEQLQNSTNENKKESGLKLLDILYKHKKENYILNDEEKEDVLKFKSNVLNSLFGL